MTSQSWSCLCAAAWLAAQCVVGLAPARAAEADLAALLQPVTARPAPSRLPADWARGAVIEIDVRAYQDSDGDGYGDLRGLVHRLDYLKELGVSALLLQPIFQSQERELPRAVSDYRAIAPDHGQLGDFDELIRQAHARGLGVLLDYPLQYSSQDHPLFEQSAEGPGNPYRDWYVWQPRPPAGWLIDGRMPWVETDDAVYRAWQGELMPDLNLAHPAVQAWQHDNLRFWLNRGVDGFRFDAVDRLVQNGAQAWQDQPGNAAVLDGLRRVISAYPGRIMVCAAPDRIAAAAPGRCDLSLAAGLEPLILAAAAGDVRAVRALADALGQLPPGVALHTMHVQAGPGSRLWDRYGGDGPALRLAVASSLLLAGSPWLYYGEEIGMAGAAGVSDATQPRVPMSWSAAPRSLGSSPAAPAWPLAANVQQQNVAAQARGGDTLRSFHKNLLALRQAAPALQHGTTGLLQQSGALLGLQRVLGGQRELLLFNVGRQDGVIGLEGLPPGARLQRRWPRGAAALQVDSIGRIDVRLPAQSFAVLALQP